MTKTSGDSSVDLRGGAGSTGLLPLVVAAIWACTALPVEVSLSQADPLLWRAGLADILANIALYVPLGIALRRQGWPKALGIAAALSVAVEVSQLFYPDRFTAVTDVVANIGGACVGYCLSRGDRHAAWGLDPIELTGRIAAAAVCLYALAVLVLSLPGRPSDFSNWDPGCRVIAGDELTRDRRWEGEISAAAVFNRSFDRSEIVRLCALDPGDGLDGRLDRLSPLFLSSLGGRLDSIRGLPLMDAAGHERFFRTLVESGELCIVVWFSTASEKQYGPARIFGFSKEPLAQNFSLGQEGQKIVFRLRTPTTVPGGFFPQTKTRDVLVKGRAATVAATYDGRNLRVYVGGKSKARLNLAARGRMSPYFADNGLPTAVFFLGMLMGVVWVAAACAWKRSNPVLWGAIGGSAGGLIFVLAGGAGALPELAAWVPVLSAWGGAVVGGAAIDRGSGTRLCSRGPKRPPNEGSP